MSAKALPLPPHYAAAADKAEFVVTGNRWLNYGALQAAALEWRRQHSMKPRSRDAFKIAFLGIDIQDTFCHPLGELFVAGRSGTGAVDDAVTITEWLYRYMHVLTALFFSLDTHRTFAIFHASFLVDADGNNPSPFTLVSTDDVLSGKWRVNPFMASALEVDLMAAQRHLEHYTRQLEKRGRYALTIWPYHGMLGGRGHKLVTGVEEAAFFHAVARGAQTGYEVKGTNVWTEDYSIFGPEVMTDAEGRAIAQRRTAIIHKLLTNDALVVSGQSKSHCVGWSIDDALEEILANDPSLAQKIYLLEDATSPVVIPGVLDYTDDADRAFERFGAAGMHRVRTDQPLESWPGIRL